MPLTASTDYKNALTSTIKEEWIFELRNNTYTDGSVNTQYIRVGTALVGSGATQYHSLITSLPSIRESIDLVESTSKVGNISITCVNGQLSNHSNATLAEEIYGGTRKYINRDVVVQSRVGGHTNTIYTGRLKSVRLQNQDVVTIEIAARTPIDFLKIPEHTSQSGNFFPILYGTATPLSSSVSNPGFNQYDSVKVFPLEVDTLNNNRYNCLAHQAVTGDGRLHYPIKDLFHTDGNPIFTSLDDQQNSSTNVYEGVTDSDKNVLFTSLDLDRSYKYRPIQKITVSSPSVGLPVNSANFYDINGSSFTTWAVTMPQGNNTTTLEYDIEDIAKEEHDIQKCELYVKWGITNYDESPGLTLLGRLKVSCTYGGLSNTKIINTESSNRTAAYESAIDLLSTSNFSNANGQIPDKIEITFEVQGSVPGGESESPGSLTITAHDFHLVVQSKITDTDTLANSSAVTSVKKLYTGTDGFDQSWNSGNVATNISQMHRDLIYRFAGITTEPENYSTLNSARSSWTVFYYLNKQKELSKVLEQAQKEGGFIFRFKANDGSPQYIYLVDSPSTNHTISKSDIMNTNISLTPFDNLITKRVLKYQRNPINDELLFEKTFTDTTNNPRGNYNVQSEENVSSEDLEILSGGIGAANGNMGSGNKNDGYANYYNAIEGNPKILIETDIINPGSSGGSHFYLMEVGDICAFDHTDMIVEPFGESFNGKKFMVVGLTRNPGKLKVSLREI